MNLSNFIDAITKIRNEENNLLKFMRSLNLSQDQKILDVGCGHGDKLVLLRTHGFNVVGVDVNQKIIDSNIEKGIICMSASDFNHTNDLYDVVLMSHIIEHFQPDALLNFIDNYLRHLKTGGHLIITSPLFSPYFYEDFDHVKPYHPTGISMVFGHRGAQVQYYSEHKLELVNLWFRRGPHRLVFSPRLYINKKQSIPIITNSILSILFRMSFGLIGRTDGWMGLYRKVSG